MPAETLLIPDTLRSWPWPPHINPNYAICKEESSAWCEAFNACDAKAQKVFNLCDFSLLASLAYPLLNKDGCRVACDWMYFVFLVDDHTDLSNTESAQNQSDILMDALRNPHTPRPANEWVGGEAARQFWENAIRTMTPSAQRRFVDTFQQYITSVVQQATDREARYIRNVHSYMLMRRDTIGSRPAFAICEMHMNIPDEIMAHPAIVRLSDLSTDGIIISNDLCSYNVEQARGDDNHNLVTVVMNQYRMDVQDAMDWIGELHGKMVDEFMEIWRTVPTFGGPVDREIRTYVDGMANWVRANSSWAFESQRYFGKEGVEIMHTRTVELLPKRSL
ncbi:terpenoid synthase [Roridomyces roridus]|uniref:Terpene synthase n=1 Tax=Roridomyces roridus TaxID=1738132 RepID=A0AAD7G1S2_9AGAR|nr:terpenoid synthase [Roridomyces roridus]